MLMASPTALNPDGCGWRGEEAAVADGYTTSPDDCAAAEYDSQLTDVAGRANLVCGLRLRHVFWPDPTALREESCSASTTDSTARCLLAGRSWH